MGKVFFVSACMVCVNWEGEVDMLYAFDIPISTLRHLKKHKVAAGPRKNALIQYKLLSSALYCCEMHNKVNKQSPQKNHFS